VRVGGQRFTGLRVAEFAGACADIAQYHKGGGAAVPAFTNVRTVSAGTYCMEVIPLNKMFHPCVVLPARPLHLKPFRKSSPFLHIPFIGPQNYKKGSTYTWPTKRLYQNRKPFTAEFAKGFRRVRKELNINVLTLRPLRLPGDLCG